jgi:hypothetical protein
MIAPGPAATTPVGLAHGTSSLHHFCWEFAQFSNFMRLGEVFDAYNRLMASSAGRHGAADDLFANFVDPAGLDGGHRRLQRFEPRVIDVPPFRTAAVRKRRCFLSREAF